MFLIEYSGRSLLFDCAFDEAIDDYPSEFTVYLVPDQCKDDLQIAYDLLISNSLLKVGKIPVNEVKFDHTLRKSVFTKNFSLFLDIKG